MRSIKDNNAVEKNKGKWILKFIYPKIKVIALFECSNCKRTVFMPYDERFWDYCPRCGKPMRGILE